MLNLEEYVSINDLARILGVTKQAIQKRLAGGIKSGDVIVKTEGNKYLIKSASIPQDFKDEIEFAQMKASREAKRNVEKAEEILKTSKKDINFEKELWAAADNLRGSIDPSEYKYVVLGLIFLKYISDSFKQRREELKEKMSDPSQNEFVENEEVRIKMLEDRDLYKSEGNFYVPEKARWSFLQSKAALSDIARYIDEAMEAIENENPDRLKGVLFKNYVSIPLDSRILGELVNIFSRIDFNHNLQKEKDILGRVYEYFLGQFADTEGKRGGSFYTPRPVVKLLVEILEPFENSRVMDSACGSGGMFVQSSNFLKDHHKDPTKIFIYGQESNQTTWKLCKMNLAIRGVYGLIELGNTYYDDKFPDLKVDFSIQNPPFNAEWDPKRLSDKDPRIKYGTPPSSNANFLWIQHFLHHLTPNGIAGFVMANGALAVGGKEGEIRQRMIEDDVVDVIIACPPKLFYNVALPVSLWFMTKNKATGRFRNRVGETLFIDAKDIFTQISRKQVEFTDEQIKKIADTVRAWRGEEGAGEYKDIAGYCKAVKKDEIAENGYVLTPGRYVGVPEEPEDDVLFEERMQEYEEKLTQYFAESKELDKKILDIFKKINL